MIRNWWYFPVESVIFPPCFFSTTGIQICLWFIRNRFESLHTVECSKIGRCSPKDSSGSPWGGIVQFSTLHSTSPVSKAGTKEAALVPSNETPSRVVSAAR